MSQLENTVDPIDVITTKWWKLLWVTKKGDLTQILDIFMQQRLANKLGS